MNRNTNTADLIIQTRITLPKTPTGIVRRERLIKQLADNIDKPLILICSPAGYGKTTLIQDFLSNQKFVCTWFHVTSDVNNLYTFFDYLIHSLKRLNEQFGQNTIQLLESDSRRYRLLKNLKNNVIDVVGTFANDFNRSFKEDVILVIDDLHNAEKPEWLRAAFDVLIENFPENLHLIITSRGLPGFGLNYLTAKRMILKLDMGDLNFTRKEIKQLLTDIYAMPCTEKDVDVLESSLSGWITGLHLILQAYGKDFTKIIPNTRDEKLRIPGNIFKFFADEIFKKLDSGTQHFLLNTALLETFNTGVCDQLLGIRNSGKIIEALLSKNIFIQAEPIPEGETANENMFSYQVLFKKFLTSKYYELTPASAVKKTLKKIYEYYKKRGDIISAMKYVIMAGNHPPRRAIGIIKTNFQKLFEAGKYEILWKWLISIKEDTLHKDAHLLFYKSLLQKFFIGDLEGSLPYLKKAVKLLEKKKDSQLLIKCYISEADTLLSIGGETEEAIKLLNRLVTRQTSPENKARLMYFLAMAYYKNAKYDDSIPLLYKSLDICKQKNLKEISTDILRLLGNIYLIRGEYTKSIYHYEQVADKTYNVTNKFETVCNLVLLFSQSDNYEKAKEFFDKASEMIRQFPIPIINIAYLIAKQAYRYEYGDYEENIRILEEFTSAALKLNHKYYIYLGYRLFADTYYYLNKLNRAKEYYELAKNYLDVKNELEKIEYDTMQALVQKKIKIEPQIETILLEAYGFYDTNKFIYNKVQVAYHLADYYLKSGMDESAYHYLDECLSVSAEKDYVSFLQRELIDSQVLFDFALIKEIQRDFVTGIKDSVIDKVNSGWLSPDCRERLLSHTEKLHDVKVSSFGIPEISIRGSVIPEESWIKKKRKFVFIYLLLSPKKELTKDKIIDTFYRDSPPDTAENVYHQTISIIRNIVKFGTGKLSAAETEGRKGINKTKQKTAGAKHKRIAGTSFDSMKYPPIITYEDKVLRFNPFYRFHIDAFEFNKLHKLGSESPGVREKIEYYSKAVDMYKGEFLSGFYDAWCEDLRQSYTNRFISMSEELIRILYAQEMYEDAVRYSEKLLLFDRLNEPAYFHMIESLVKLEKHRSAKDKFNMMQKTFKDELSEEPDGEFMEKIRALIPRWSSGEKSVPGGD